MSDKPLKSAYELTMERLRAKDREQGVEQQVLTDAQKAEIARLRQETKAKLAEIEIRSQSDLLVRPVERALRLRIGPDAEASLRTWLRIRDTDLLGRYAAREVDLRFRGSVVLRELRKTTRGREDGSS